MYKVCLGIRHCIANPETIYYNVAKKQMCIIYLDIAEKFQSIKSNTYKYKKDRKEKASREKISSKMDEFMRTMEDEGYDSKGIASVINMARTLANNSDS